MVSSLYIVFLMCQVTFLLSLIQRAVQCFMTATRIPSPTPQLADPLFQIRHFQGRWSVLLHGYVAIGIWTSHWAVSVRWKTSKRMGGSCHLVLCSRPNGMGAAAMGGARCCSCGRLVADRLVRPALGHGTCNPREDSRAFLLK